MERFYAIKKQEASIVQRLGSDKHPSFCGGPHESPNAGIAKPSLHNKDRVILTVRHPNKAPQQQQKLEGEPAAKRANTSQ